MLATDLKETEIERATEKERRREHAKTERLTARQVAVKDDSKTQCDGSAFTLAVSFSVSISVITALSLSFRSSSFLTTAFSCIQT